MRNTNSDIKFFWGIVVYCLFLILAINIVSPDNESSASKAEEPQLDRFYYDSFDIPGGYSESGYVQISDWDMVLKTAKSVLQVDENTHIITFSNNQKRKCTESSPVYYCKPLTKIELDALNRIEEERQALPSVYESW